MNATAKLKTKKCKQCGDPFIQYNSIRPVCAKFECQVSYAEAHVKRSVAVRERQERVKTREAKERIKTKAQWLKEAQHEFNRFIRLRDKHLPCISCQRFHDGQYHAGHYRTVGSAPELRFSDDNVHRQCSACNNYLSGNLIEYRRNLHRKIGLERLEWLEGKHEPKHYSIDDIKAIKAFNKARCKELEESK